MPDVVSREELRAAYEATRDEIARLQAVFESEVMPAFEGMMRADLSAAAVDRDNAAARRQFDALGAPLYHLHPVPDLKPSGEQILSPALPGAVVRLYAAARAVGRGIEARREHQEREREEAAAQQRRASVFARQEEEEAATRERLRRGEIVPGYEHLQQ
jgi:hypothetical protein